MRSIAILGDIRAHIVVGEDDLPASSVVMGGANMMAQAISNSLSNNSVLDKPTIYGPAAPRYEEIPRSNDSGVLRWDAKNVKVSTTKKSRYCLFSRHSAGWVHPTTPTKEFADALANGAFGEDGQASVPDVVVFDDLSLHLQEQTFQIAPGSGNMELPRDAIKRFRGALKKHRVTRKESIEEEKKIQEELRFATSEQTEEIKLRLAKQIHIQNDSASDVSSETLALLTKRLVHAAESVNDSGRSCPVEPVVVLSAGNDIPSLEVEAGQEKNVWQHIHDSDALCRRTVILFDATSLRKHISISSGLSWERTAQDVIVELKRNKRLRPYLKFGHIVIRFGLTGILLISNDGNSDWTNTLFFNPDQDDCEWTHEEDGAVLGATSVLVATVVEQLNARCAWRAGHAILHDLRYCLDQALLLTTNRLLNHFEIGYGDGSDFSIRIQTIDKDVFKSRADVLLSRDRRGKHDYRTRLAVQRVKLAPFRSRYWSILAQSCQSDLNDVAENIVMHGAKIALNTLEKPEEDFVHTWVDDIVDGMSVANIQNSLEAETRGSLKRVLSDDNSSIRRLVGDSFFASVKLLKKELADGGIEALKDSVAKRIAEFQNQLRALKKTLAEYEESDELLSVIQMFISGFDKLQVTKVKQDYLVLRDIILRSDLNEEARPYFDEIDSKRLYDLPLRIRVYLLSKVREFEPIQGWGAPISTPVLRLGKNPGNGSDRDKRLVVIDRKEVESIRAVKRMIEQYLRVSEDDQHERPLSIAVFGPPGAGKSLSVKMIVKMMEGVGKETKEMTINLSKLSGIEALEKELAKVVEVSADQKLPIVFFDEFDSSLDEKTHAWLRYFLAPMEDGELIKSAVFVFAGGTCDTFEAFSLADRTRSDPQWAEFSKKKGPDFVSRLKGHINVVGINPAGPDDDLFLVRRALALRYLLSQTQDLGETEPARIDPEMLNAFLHVPNYIHGSRSMRMLIDLCANRDGKIVSMSEVPPIHQLDMQVDGKAFATLASGQTKPVTIRDSA